MIHTSKFINKNFRIKVSGIDNEGNRINKLVGVSGLLKLIGETLAGKSSVSCPLKPSDSAPLKHSTMSP